MHDQDIIRSSRREARRVSRRDAILEVAQSNFMQRGYAGTSMSAIAQTLGGSKGTLWAYFPSKEVLFSAVVDRASQSFRDEISLILNQDENIESVLYRFACLFLQKITSAETIALNRLVIGGLKHFPETGRIYYNRVIAPIHEILAGYFSTATKRGLLRGADPLTVAQHLIGICIGGCHQQLVLGIIPSPDPSQIQQEAKNGVEAILRAYTNVY